MQKEDETLVPSGVPTLGPTLGPDLGPSLQENEEPDPENTEEPTLGPTLGPELGPNLVQNEEPDPENTEELTSDSEDDIEGEDLIYMYRIYTFIFWALTQPRSKWW